MISVTPDLRFTPRPPFLQGGSISRKGPAGHGWTLRKKNPACAGFSQSRNDGSQSPKVNSEALPPAAVVFTVTVFSVAKRSR